MGPVHRDNRCIDGTASVPRTLPCGAALALLLLSGCSADTAEPPEDAAAEIASRFAACFAADPDCVAGLLAASQPAPAPPAGSRLSTIVTEARAYLAATAPSISADRWSAFIGALEGYQTSPKPDPRRSAATAPLVVPVGDFAPGCETWVGTYREVGSFATAADPSFEGGLTFTLGCPQGKRCGAAAPYRATIEIARASPDGATGTALWLRYDEVPVRAFGNLLVAYTDKPLYDKLSLDAGPDSWCASRPPPCRSPSAGAGEVLLGVMLNCAEGNGVLQWGALER
jgi:hypothetical protein